MFIAQGHGPQPWDLKPELRHDIYRIYEDAKECLWRELDPQFVAQIPGVVRCVTRSANRADYILHPAGGEKLSDLSLQSLHGLRREHAGLYDVQVVVSDGLNALSIMDAGHLEPFLAQLIAALRRQGLRPAPENLVFTSGRVRAGYRVGEVLFGGRMGVCGLVHIIGERPGSGHHTFSAYVTAASGQAWGTAGKIDHDITKVVSGIATTALAPRASANEAAALLAQLIKQRAAQM